MKIFLLSTLVLINTLQANDIKRLIPIGISHIHDGQTLITNYQASFGAGFYFVKIAKNLLTSKEEIKVIKTTIKHGYHLPDLTAEEIAHIRSVFSK